MAVAIVLAAGQSVRMGRDKLVLPWKGGTVLGWSTAAFRRCASVIVVVRPGFRLPYDVVNVRTVVNPDHLEGMASSLRAGVAAAPEGEPLVLGLGDMPGLTPQVVQTVLDGWRGGIAVPVYEGRRGHPVVFGPQYRSALLQVQADVGARAIVREHAADVVLVPVGDPAVLRDIDTPADLEQP